MDAFDSIPSAILQALAWIFTALAGVASMALTMMKFGLSPAKRLMLIAGTIAFGLVAVLVVVPFAYKQKEGTVATTDSPAPGAGGGASLLGMDEDFVKTLIAQGLISGVIIRDDGSMELVVATEKSQQANPEDLVAVELSDDAKRQGEVDRVVAVSGTAVQAQVGSETLGVSVGDEDVIVTLGDEAEFLNRKSLEDAQDFKVTNVSSAN